MYDRTVPIDAISNHFVQSKAECTEPAKPRNCRLCEDPGE